MRAMRSTLPMRAGVRSMTRSTARMRFRTPMVPRRAAATIQSAAPRSSPGPATSSMPARRSRRVTGQTSPRSRLRVASWRLALRTARTRRCATPLNSPAIPAPKARGRRSFSGTTICMRSSSSTPRRRSARKIRPVSRTSSSNRRSPRSWIAKIRSRPSMPKTRSSSTATGSA
ncbi:hypothetical protein D9M70_465390 [compost metagenome]